MEEAVMPMEVYRLEAPGLEITYKRRHNALTLAVSDDCDLFPARDEVSGSYVAAAVTEPAIGIRADAELHSEINRRITLTLLLPEVQWQAIDAETVKVGCVAVVTVWFFQTYMDASYPLEHYHVRQLTGTVSMEV
jgi:hypothetical protein